MTTTVVFEDQIEIPLDLQSLADFRQWALSDDFPNRKRGRIDYIAGRIEVNMSPEDFFCHGTLKTEIAGVLYQHIKQGNLGYLVTDSTRVSSVQGDVSAEPDIVFIAHKSLASERVRLVPKAGGAPGRYIEVEGAADLIVEIVSDSSVTKDTQRLPAAYFNAGVTEFWLVDARHKTILFQIHGRGPNGFEPVTSDREGYQTSAVFRHRFRLDGNRDPQGNWRFDLRQQ